MKTTPVTQDFARYEFKYVMRTRDREVLEAEIRHLMEVDGHSDGSLDNKYVVRSLYFDNMSATNYYEKIDGIRTRRKFRLRTYRTTADQQAPTFLEEKGRHIERTYKHRIQIEEEYIPLFEDPTQAFRLTALYPGVPLIEHFVADILRRQQLPRVLIDYRRRPYVSKYDANFRVTFDDSLQATALGLLLPAESSKAISCMSGYTILEIKFFRRIPAWFHRLLQAHGMRRVSVSKFCLGMEACGLAEDLS